MNMHRNGLPFAGKRSKNKRLWTILAIGAATALA